MEILPGVGWANSIPDADVTVNITVHGSTLSFIGTGYHDKVPTTTHPALLILTAMDEFD